MEPSETRKQWEAAAPGWAKWEGVISTWIAPATETMLDMAGVKPGARVLDLACGAGSQSLAAARRVGANGHVVASDISETMLEHVQRNAREVGLSGISTLRGPAEELDVEPASFDAVICRLGLMLFPQPANAVAAAKRALKPGGRMAVVVFTNPAANPARSKCMQILLRHAGKQPPPPGQPGLFALGAPGKIEQVFAEGGFPGIERKEMQIPMKMRSGADALLMMQEAFGAFRAVVKDCTPEVRDAAWSEVAAMLATFDTADGFVTPGEVLVAGAAK